MRLVFFCNLFLFNEKYNTGKEIILRRYLNDQSPDLSGSLNHHPGFLNVAINHLKEKNNQRPRNHRKRKKLTTASLDG